jgi:hypothetical protein
MRSIEAARGAEVGRRESTSRRNLSLLFGTDAPPWELQDAPSASRRSLLAAAAASVIGLPSSAWSAAPAELVPDKIGGVDINAKLCESGIFTNAFESRCTTLGNLETVLNKEKDMKKDDLTAAQKLEAKMAAKRAASVRTQIHGFLNVSSSHFTRPPLPIPPPPPPPPPPGRI